jgi:hypothetical protein
LQDKILLLNPSRLGHVLALKDIPFMANSLLGRFRVVQSSH